MDEPNDAAALPAPRTVGHVAAEVLRTLKADEEFGRLRESALLYIDSWTTHTGLLLIARWDIDRDSAPLLGEAAKVLALGAAVYELTEGNEHLAELAVSPPVGEMVHAVIAQTALCTRIQQRTKVPLAHMPDCDRFGFEAGDYTEQSYRAAGWGALPPRYWLGAAEVGRRLGLLAARYESIGIYRGGRSHQLDFGTGAPDDQAPAELRAG